MTAAKKSVVPKAPAFEIHDVSIHNGPKFDEATCAAIVALANASAEHGKALAKMAALFDGTSTTMNNGIQIGA